MFNGEVARSLLVVAKAPSRHIAVDETQAAREIFELTRPDRRTRTWDPDYGESPMGMLKSAYAEITKISKMLENQPTTSAGVRVTRLRWRLQNYLARAKNQQLRGRESDI